MVHRSLILIVLLTLSIAGWHGLGYTVGSDATHALASASSRTHQLQGMSSCAASLCHGGNIVGQPRGEAATWRAQDPHAGAYETLMSSQSQAIAQLLWGENHPAHEAALCLKCHVHPDYQDATPNFRREDGVSCESCHGAANDWKEAHFRKGWKDITWADKDALGFADTKRLPGRAAVCATCHVGAPGMEVDHDLIAAGHPALRFEFATYFANLPPHWDAERDKKANSSDDRTDFEGRAWVIGQLATSAQALELLAHHASNSEDKRWPELSQLDCFACHHDLQTTSWRQGDSYLQKRKPGSLTLNNWYYALLPDILALTPGAKEIALPLKVPNLFDKEDRLQLSDQAKNLAKTMRDIAAQPPRLTEPGSRSVFPLMNGFRYAYQFDQSWEAATQRYLALLALRQMQMDNARSGDADLKNYIDKMGREVTFERGMASPAKWAPKK